MATREERVSGGDAVSYDMKLAGRRVRHAREDLGWDRGRLAEALTARTPEVWTKDKVMFLELGRRRIDPPLLRVLSEIQGRPANYYLYVELSSTPELSRVSSVGRAAVL